jgi:hypothetical protein
MRFSWVGLVFEPLMLSRFKEGHCSDEKEN